MTTNHLTPGNLVALLIAAIPASVFLLIAFAVSDYYMKGGQ